MKRADLSILPRYQAGAQLAQARVNAHRTSGARKKSMRASKRIIKPPVGGWTGGTV